MDRNPLLAQFAGTPALVAPESKDWFESCLHAVIGHEHGRAMLEAQASADDEGFWPAPGDWRCAYRPYNVVGGILQIPVKGVLLNEFPYALGSWATGYEYIWQAFKRGCADFAIGQIKGIAFVENTPGGMVAGCFDAVDKMVALKEQTGVPVAAFAHEAAYSAGYAVATVADKGRIYVSRTGGVGSIGVVTGHLDVSGAMEKAGLKFTYIASDPSKVEGNPYEPLSAEAYDRIKARIDEIYDIFAAAVSRSRGLSLDALKNELKAYCYTASQALSNGLADSIGSLEEALSAYADTLDDQSDNSGEEDMSTTDTSAVDQAAVDAARAEGTAAGRTEGAKAERERITAILGSEQGKTRPKAALAAALETDMTVEQATSFIGKLAEEKAEAPAEGQGGKSPFESAMEGTKNPELGAGDGQQAEMSVSDRIMANAGYGAPGSRH